MSASNGNGSGLGGGSFLGRDEPRIWVPRAPTELTPPPQDIEAERCVLGAMLLDNDVIPAVAELLRPEDFFRDNHQVIFRTMLAVVEAAKPLDVILLIDELRRRSVYDQIGGDDALAEIVAAPPHAANARYHAQLVKEKSVARAILEASEQILREAYSDRYSSEQLLATASRRLAEVEGTCGVNPGATLIRLSDVESTPVDWLWPGRFPLGALSLLVGDPGLGKSFLTMALAAAVSSGACWPDAPGVRGEPSSVVLLSAEDSLARTVRPRLDAAGADCTRVHALTTVRRPDGKLAPFALASDLPRLDQVLKRLGDVRLLVIDPISAYVGGADEHKNAEVRSLIGPLSDLAERHRVAVVMVTHLNKGTGSKAIYRATGSLAFVAASRIAWLVASDKADRARRVMLPIKCNIAETPTGMGYRLVGGSIQWEAEPITTAADDFLAEDGGGGGSRRPEGAGRRGPVPVKTREAMEWIAARLELGPERHSDLLKAAEDAGIARATFYDAVTKLDLERSLVGSAKYLGLRPPECPETPPDDAPIF